MSAGIAIGLDIGTSGVRVALVDAGGERVGFGVAPMAAERLRDAEGWWAAVEQAFAALSRTADLSGVRAIACDGTSGTVLAIDAAGRPLAPARMYNDRAEPDLVRRIAAIAPPESAAHGATSPLARLLALQRLPGIARVLHQADWIAGRLAGRFDFSDTNNALKTGFDAVAGVWPDWFEPLGVRRALLPQVREPGEPIGPVGVEACALGLPPTALLVAGTTDGCAAFLATGAAEPGDGVTSLGSTLTLKLLSDKPIFAPAYGIYSHRLCGAWLAGGASNSGGAALSCHFDAAALAALSARIDPSRPSGLDYYPLPAIGERFPIADATAASRVTPRPADDVAFLHGLLEGIAAIEALGYRRLAELGAPRLARLRSVGGGAGNAVWSTIRARLLGVTLWPARATDAAVGTAGLALAAL